MHAIRDLPEWRDWRAYAPLLQAERAAFAWEWLRRDPIFRAEALEAVSARRSAGKHEIGVEAKAARWGLHAFEDPRLAVPDARPVWTAGRHPFVLNAVAEPCFPGPDAFELGRFARLATLIHGRWSKPLLLSDGIRGIRLDVCGSSLSSGAVQLKYELRGIASARPQLLVLQRLLALLRTQGFSPGLQPAERRASRFVLLLRTYDALQDGADQRTIAAELLSRGALEKRWRVNSPSLRSQAQRLVQSAISAAAGGFWDLLQ